MRPGLLPQRQRSVAIPLDIAAKIEDDETHDCRQAKENDYLDYSQDAVPEGYESQ